jgi:hypothetical protein
MAFWSRGSIVEFPLAPYLPVLDFGSSFQPPSPPELLFPDHHLYFHAYNQSTVLQLFACFISLGALPAV